ncbi:DUF2845 domain-containing protein [Candidatus Methylocalor cossyra]|uniref:DUF2845 domain-containing protein n=1 Tax=Candidatus Methylocalor cossyra TaxID=3108543 RepID=A0ABM9NJB3_9GAMM
MLRFAACLVLWGIAFDAWAWRCNGWIIEPGKTLYEVGQKCGEPEAADQRIEWRTLQNFEQRCDTRMEPVEVPATPPATGGPRIEYRPRTVCFTIPVSVTVPVQVEEWYYSDQGVGNVPKLLRFENGRLVFIETLWGQRNMP